MVVSELENKLLGDENSIRRIILPAVLLGLLCYSSFSEADGLSEVKPHYNIGVVEYNSTPSYLVGEGGNGYR